MRYFTKPTGITKNGIGRKPNVVEASCDFCKKIFWESKSDFYDKRKKHNHFCSMKCLGNFKKGKVSHRRGKKCSIETKLKMSEYRTGRTGDKSSNWKGGISKDSHSLTNPLYKQWRIDVFERDNYTCQDCGKKGCYLEAHHIKSWAKFEKLRFF